MDDRSAKSDVGSPGTLGFLSRNRAALGFLLIGLGVVLIAVAGYASLRETRSRAEDNSQAETRPSEIPPAETKNKKEPKPATAGEYLPLAVWAGLMSALAIVAGITLTARVPSAGKETHEMRIVLVSAGSAAGFMLTLLGFAYGWRWQQSLVLWVNKGDLQEARWVLAALAIGLAGLALMFVSMQPARAEERNSVVLRRMLYGTNAALMGLLLLMGLTTLNVFAATKLPESVISTAAGFKGLSKTSQEFLRTIKEPVKIYLIMPEDFRLGGGQDSYDSAYSDCKALLQAVSSQNPNISVEYLSPATDDDAIRRLMTRLKVPDARRKQVGLLVVYGEIQETSEFMPVEELFGFPDPNRRTMAFAGENRLMTELNFLSGGARRPVIYFTQSNGEPLIGKAPKDAVSRTAHRLAQYLQERKFDVKPLLFEPGKKPDLTDAAIVVIGAPQRPFTADEVNVLREYVEPKQKGAQGGKIIAMLPAFPEVLGGKVSLTGLEQFLVEVGIRLRVEEPGDQGGKYGQRVFVLPQSRAFPPELVPGRFATELYQAGDQLTRDLAHNNALFFSHVRPVIVDRDEVSKKFAFGSSLFVTLPEWTTYIDTDYDSNPNEILERVAKENRENRSETYNKKRVGLRVPIGAFVAQVAQDSARVRLAVIGSDCFIDDVILEQSQRADVHLAVIGDIFDFVRDRPQGMGIQATPIGTFDMPKQADSASLLYVPFGLIVLGIAAMGVGVWYARRM